MWLWHASSHSGEWSSKNCEVTSSNRTHTSCDVSHLTSFAILVSPYTPVRPRALRSVTMLSVACYLYLQPRFCLNLVYNWNWSERECDINCAFYGPSVYTDDELLSVACLVHHLRVASHRMDVAVSTSDLHVCQLMDNAVEDSCSWKTLQLRWPL